MNGVKKQEKMIKESKAKGYKLSSFLHKPRFKSAKFLLAQCAENDVMQTADASRISQSSRDNMSLTSPRRRREIGVNMRKNNNPILKFVTAVKK